QFAPVIRPRPDLLAQSLSQDRIVAIARPRHPRIGRTLDLKAFLAIPQIRVIYPEDVRIGFIDTVLASGGLERRVALTVAHLVSVPVIVSGSDLLGIVPERLARAWARGHALPSHDRPL